MFILVTYHTGNHEHSTRLITSKESYGYSPLQLCFDTREEAEQYIIDKIPDNGFVKPSVLEMKKWQINEK